MKELVENIYEIARTYVGKIFNENEFEYIDLIRAEDDGSDTDLYTCVVSNDSGWITFYVDTDPKTKEILSVDTHSVSYSLKDSCKVVDCVDLKEVLA